LSSFDFKIEYKKWLEHFDSENNNCILQQAYNMLFETLIYKCILKARSIAPKDSHNKIKLNGSIHYLIDKCFFATQLMTIRRLTDKKGSDIISLYKLLKSMEENNKYLTRKNYFMILQERGYHYDYSEIMKREEEYLHKNLKMDTVICVPEELNWKKSYEFHSHFDKLSKTQFDNRTPEDFIAPSVFEKLLNKLDCCGNLREHVDSFIAHSLKAEKIEKLDDEALRVTYEQLWEAQKVICSVINFIGLYLIGISDYGLLPLSHGTLLHYIEEPLVSKEEKSKLYKEEEIFRNEIYSWKINIDDFCG
jgi:hypothetical protein